MFNPESTPRTFQDHLASLFTKYYFLYIKNPSLSQSEVKTIFEKIFRTMNEAKAKLEVSSLTQQIGQSKLKSTTPKELAKYLISKLTQSYKGYTFPCDEIIQFIMEEIAILRSKDSGIKFNGNAFYSLYFEVLMLYCEPRGSGFGVDTQVYRGDILPIEKYTDSSSLFGKTPLKHFDMLLEERYKPLRQAIQQGDIKILRECIQKGVYLGFVDIDGNTPLHWAVLYKQKDAIKVLLGAIKEQNVGYLLEQKNKKFKTPEFSADWNDRDIGELFKPQSKETKQTKFSESKEQLNDKPPSESSSKSPLSTQPNFIPAQQKLTNLEQLTPKETIHEEKKPLKQEDSNKLVESTPKAYRPPQVQQEIGIHQQKVSTPISKFEKDSKKPVATLEISFSLSREDLTFDKELGRGGFGIVFKGKWQHTEVAIKQLQAAQLSEKTLEEFQSEMKFMASLNYPNIVRLFGITDTVPYCMVMEYLPKGDLYNLLHSKEQLSADQIAKIALDIARGVAYLHQRNIMHRDLKSKNILLDEGLRAKVADFGLAKIRTETQTSSTQGMVGTLAWMAPEIILGETYTLKADIYSFGVILWELTARQTPFAKANGNQVLIATWKSMGKYDEIPQGTPEKLAKLIGASWAQEPQRRPTAEEVVQQLQTQNITSASALKPTEYRSNLDSTSMDSGYRDNLESEKSGFRP